MARRTSSPAVVTVAHVAVNIALVLTVLGGVVFAVLTLVNPGAGRLTVDIASSNVESLPSNVELATVVPVHVEIENPSFRQGLGLWLAGLPWFALTVLVLVLLRGLVRTVRRGNPFIGDNVRRLRWIGFALIVGGPVLQIVPRFFVGAVAEGAASIAVSSRFEVPGTLPIVGLGVLLLAQVFAHGVSLREDVEGTV